MQPRHRGRARRASGIRVLGASTFLLGAAFAACGPAEPLTCGPDTCASGCCSESGECLTFDEQSFTQCGRGGDTCFACLPGEICNAQGRCTADPDAGTGTFTCDPTTCSGCCAGDECVPLAGQTSLQCGSAGQACAVCPQGAFCQQGTCMPAGGSDGGADCGRKGEPCCANDGCFLGLTCSAGVCTTQSPPDGGTAADAGTGGALAIGEACTTAPQCHSGECRIIGFPGGYCTRGCTTNADCPDGSVCGNDPNDATGVQKICLDACAAPGTASGCRADYVCDKRGTLTGGGACVPGCLSPATCGAATTCDARGFCCGANGYACCGGNTCDTGLTCDASGYCKPESSGSGAIGDPCTSNGACASGLCAFEAPGGSPGCATGPCWPGGYCIADCTNTACPAGASCTPYLAANSLCMENCTTPGGQSTCRSGYVCDKNWIPNVSQAVCVDACNSAADCNSPKLDCHQGFCCGSVSYRCCAGDTCPHGGTCGPDGYCQ